MCENLQSDSGSARLYGGRKFVVFTGEKMKRFIVSVLLIVAIALISVACGSASVKNSNTQKVSQVGQVKPEVENSENSQKTIEQLPQWVEDGGESVSSSKERCVIGKVSYTQNAEDFSMAVMDAFDRARIKFCRSTVSVDIDTASDTTVTKMSRCVIPATEKREVWKSADGIVYVLVCANRNEIDDEYEDERMEKADEDIERENL